jgi:hypothetical protein
VQCPNPVGHYADPACTVPFGSDASAAMTDSGAPPQTSDAAGASPGDASSQDAASTACNLPPTELKALLDRWNAAVNAVATPIDFHWLVCDHFPHPTFKGGTADAYGQFATVLLQFFQQGDDFAFLANNDLFSISLLYVFPSGGVGVNTSFKQLAAFFSSATGFGDQSTATRQALASFLARIP